MDKPLGSSKMGSSSDKELDMMRVVVDKEKKIEYTYGFAQNVPEYWLEAWYGGAEGPGPVDVVGGTDGIYGSHTNLYDEMVKAGIWDKIPVADQACILMDLPFINETNDSNKEDA